MSITQFDPTDDLAVALGYPLLRAPGLGVYSESSGSSPYASRLHDRLYGTGTPARVEELWRETLSTASHAPTVLLGVPSDTGSGSMRGAAYGPVGIREALYDKDTDPIFHDLGDILCIPHLLHDDMLNETQINDTRAAVFGDTVLDFPVSPLSITESVVRGLLNRQGPAPTIVSLGGDHSITGAILPPFLERYGPTLGVIHIDAHSDLSENRFGISLTYSSWVMHVERRTKIGALAQVGLADLSDNARPSKRLLQIGANAFAHDDVRSRLIAWLTERGVERVYITVDIDATDRQWAPATGLPAQHGLTPNDVVSIIDTVGDAFPIVGADVVEVAPPLGSLTSWGQEPTCQTAAHYLHALFQKTRTVGVS